MIPKAKKRRDIKARIDKIKGKARSPKELLNADNEGVSDNKE